MDAIGRVLRDAEDGSGSVILVEGPAGSGKTLLLEEAARVAAGFRVASSCAFAGDDAGSMAPLLAALFGSASPLLDPSLLEDARFVPTDTIDSLDWLEDALATAARQRPLLVTIDDAHCIDRGTAAALRILPGRLAKVPIVWMLAARPGASVLGRIDHFAELHCLGSEHLRLPPLEDHAVAQLISDVLRAEPSPGLLELAALAGGNPSLTLELVDGAVDESLVHISAGRAELLDLRVPRRVRHLTNSRLAGISPFGRRAAAVAAELGPTFSFDHLATMLDVPPAALLAPVEELVRAEVLADVGTHFAFHNKLLREAASGILSPTVRHALRRQAIDVLLMAGMSPIEPARRLAACAEVGDRVAVSTLIAAARAVSTSNPEVAADLGRLAVDLMNPTDVRRPSLAAEAALLLHAAGRTEEGIAIVEGVLRERRNSEGDALVRLSIARMSDVASEVRIDAGRQALTVPELGLDLRAKHIAQLILNLAESGETDAAQTLMTEADAAVVRGGDGWSSNVLELAKARLDQLDGDYRGALARLDALELGSRRDDRAAMWLADLRRAELLLAVDQVDAALELASQCGAIAKRDGHVAAAREWQRVLGRCQLHAGLIGDAMATLGEDVGYGQGAVPVTPSDGAMLVDQARIAIHIGDRTSAREFATRAANAPADSGPEIRRQATWVVALHAMAEGDPDRARAALAQIGRSSSGGGLPRTADSADLVQLARIARALDDHELARVAVAEADGRLRRNPGVSSIASAAAHVRGLVRGELSELRTAAELLAGGPRRLARASALEDLGMELAGRGDDGLAIEAFDDALRLYSGLGATWDASRVRRRLRDRGIRRRLVRSGRRATGWDGLTDSEVAVVRLVAQGLSNRAAAAQLFLSPHTVSMHLRHVFTKLAINSRVELTRLAVQHGIAA